MRSPGDDDDRRECNHQHKPHHIWCDPDCAAAALPPKSQKRPTVMPSRCTIVARPVIGTVERAVPINPTRDGMPPGRAITLAAWLADDARVFEQCWLHHRTCLVDKRHREGRCRQHADCQGRQHHPLHRFLHDCRIPTESSIARQRLDTTTAWPRRRIKKAPMISRRLYPKLCLARNWPRSGQVLIKSARGPNFKVAVPGKWYLHFVLILQRNFRNIAFKSAIITYPIGK
jgi:hypothetical protein